MKKYYSYIMYLLTSVLVVLLYANNFGPMNNLQRWVDDSFSSFTADEGRKQNIVLVNIDAQSIDKYGAWPWNRDLIADLLAATAAAEPKTIVVDFPLAENAYQDSAGYTNILAGQLSWIKNIVFPYDIALASYRSSKTNNPEYLFNYSMQVSNPLGLMNESSSLLVRKTFLPALKILKTDPQLGFEYIMPDDDRILRHQALTMNYEGYYYPSLSLIAATNFLKIPFDMVQVNEGVNIELGSKITIPINSRSEMYINFSRGNPFQSFSAAKVLEDGFNFSLFKNKLVLICVNDYNYTEMFQTPLELETPQHIVRATIIENIINNNLLTHKTDMTAMTMLMLFVLGGLCAFILPQVSILYRMVILFCGFVILANVNYFLFSSFNLIVETVYLGLELLLFMFISPILDSELVTGEQADKKSSKKSLPKINLDDADKTPVKTRELKESEADEDWHKTEMISQASKSDADYIEDHTAIDISGEESETIIPESKTAVNFDKPIEDSPDNFDSGNDDLGIVSTHHDSLSDSEKVKRLTNDSANSLKHSATPTAGSLTNLGRYQIVGTLGKGAMGHVYKGIDPAINRPVALKTIRLDFINDPEEMEELKTRLQQEAQAVGKLSHPNIVTIYDVGSEGSLQYIAMECLEGQTLEEMIKRKTNFNYKIISQIIMQICSALEYAHSKNIVHRDIKPANIMILQNYQVKVMDFGIARIESSSMTKTGIAMGTPNYISPEQLQGLRVDNRSDLFSLGVVMYELLIGKRPFKGENITSLIYSILNKDPEKPSNIRPQIPLLFDHIVAKALSKKPQDRYQKASDITNDLAEFVEAFTHK